MKIDVQTVPSRWVAYRRVTCRHEEIGDAITSNDMLPGIYEYAGRNLADCRAPYARYLDWREHDCDVQVGVQLAGSMPPIDNIVIEHYAACRAMVAVFIGPYIDLPRANRECHETIERNGYTLAGPCWELYDGPPAENGIARTLIHYPVLPSPPPGCA